MLIWIAAQLASPSSHADLLGAAKPYIGTKIVEVQGQRYRVSIKKTGEVVVASKAILVGRNAQLHDQMLAAVSLATGCKLGQELWTGTKLRGKLDCDGRGVTSQ